jgi:hypothetical protein
VLFWNLSWMKLTMGKLPAPLSGCTHHRFRHTGQCVGTTVATSCDGELEADSQHMKRGGWSVQVTGVSLRLTRESQPTTGFI